MRDLINSNNFNDDISKWNVSNVTNMSNIFKDAVVFNQPVQSWNWNVSNNNDRFNYMFRDSGMPSGTPDSPDQAWFKK